MQGFEWTLELRFALALGLGFLVGLERESSGADRKTGRVFAGVRTYTIISMYGFACAWLYRIDVTMALPVGMLSVAALALVGYLAKLREGRVGWTSEIAALLTFVVGVLTLLTDIWVPMTLGIVSTILLSEKGDLESFVDRLNKSEFLAVLKFLVVTAIILPALPDQSYTKFNLNPTHIWQIVILVSSIGFVGYFLTKKFGSRLGLWLSGLLGGIVSSTAVSIAAGRVAQRHPERSFDALQMSLLASSVMYLRILVLVWVLNPVIAGLLWWKCLLLTGIGIALTLWGSGRSTASSSDAHISTLENPFELKPAFIFAAVFVLLTVATAFAKQLFGSAGLFGLSFVVGVVDIDPYILSLVHDSGHGPLIVMAVLIAMMSNTLAKGSYFTVLARDRRRDTIWRYGLWALLHIPLLFL
ncbi:MAG: MgtC/SapB family protein [Bacteroidetes bacterium]|nr:MgtC/SapB family protein [Bacteroidota bacterium]